MQGNYYNQQGQRVSVQPEEQDRGRKSNTVTAPPKSVSPGLSTVQQRIIALEEQKRQEAEAKERAKTPQFHGKDVSPAPPVKPQQQPATRPSQAVPIVRPSATTQQHPAIQPIVHAQHTQQPPAQHLHQNPHPTQPQPNSYQQPPTHQHPHPTQPHQPTHQQQQLPSQQHPPQQHPHSYQPQQPAQQHPTQQPLNHQPARPSNQLVRQPQAPLAKVEPTIQDRIQAISKKSEMPQPEPQQRLSQLNQKQAQRNSRTPQPEAQQPKPQPERLSRPVEPQVNKQAEVSPQPNNVKVLQQRWQQQQTTTPSQPQQTQNHQPQPQPQPAQQPQVQQQIQKPAPVQQKQPTVNPPMQQSAIQRPSITPDPRIEKSKLNSKFDPNFLMSLSMQVSQGALKPKTYGGSTAAPLKVGQPGQSEVSYEHLNRDQGKLAGQLSTVFEGKPQPRTQSTFEPAMQHGNFDRAELMQKTKHKRAQQQPDDL